MKKTILIFVCIHLCACTSNYQAFNKGVKHGSGYQEIKLNKDKEPIRYWLSYKGHSGDNKSIITQYWHQRAAQLCINGYTVIKHKQSIRYGTMKTPVGGIMATVGTETPYDSGEIECH